MGKYFILFSIFALTTSLSGSLFAEVVKTLEDGAKTEDQNSVEDVDPFLKGVPESTVFDFASTAKDERDRLLKILKTEVEPNLIKADADRIKRNVMRLGSYRRDWVQAASEFLVANAAVSELYLYQYTMTKNARLTKEILKTLLDFPTLRYPRGPLAFFSFFVIDRRDLDRPLLLLEKSVEQDPSLAPDIFASLSGTLGDAINLTSRLRFAEKACEKTQLPASAIETIKLWRSQVKDFWERVVSAEAEACVRGH